MILQEKIRPGYKQTEIGNLPEDWEVEPLGQRIRRPPTYGINAPATSFDYRFPTYLRITDITDDGRFAAAEDLREGVCLPTGAKHHQDVGALWRDGASRRWSAGHFCTVE